MPPKRAERATGGTTPTGGWSATVSVEGATRSAGGKAEEGVPGSPSGGYGRQPAPAPAPYQSTPPAPAPVPYPPLQRRENVTASEPEPEPSPVRDHHFAGGPCPDCETAKRLGDTAEGAKYGAHQVEYFSLFIDVQTEGRLGWNIVSKALEPELNDESLVCEHDDRESLVFHRRMVAYFGKLDEFERLCDDIQTQARNGRLDDGSWDNMMRSADTRQEKATGLLQDLGGDGGMLGLARAELQKLETRADAICQRWRDGTVAVVQGQPAAGPYDNRPEELDVSSSHFHLFAGKWATKQEVEKARDEFTSTTCIEEFSESTEGNMAVLGDAVKDKVTDVMRRRQAQVADFERFFLEGYIQTPEEAASSAKNEVEIRRLEQETSELLRELRRTAQRLRLTAHDFMAAQYCRAYGEPWQGPKLGQCCRDGEVQYRDDVGKPRDTERTAWQLSDCVARDCLQEVGVCWDKKSCRWVADESHPQKLYTVCGLRAVVALLERREQQLKELPRVVRDKDSTGEKIEAADHEIDRMSHHMWIRINRLQERQHEQSIQNKAAQPSIFSRGGGGGASTSAADEQERREYSEAQAELQRQLEGAQRLRQQFQELENPDPSRGNVGLPEVVRTRRLSYVPCFCCPAAHCLCSDVVHSQSHPTFQDFIKSDKEAVRGRLTYPDAFFSAIEDLAKKNNGGKITKNAFDDYYAAGLGA